MFVNARVCANDVGRAKCFRSHSKQRLEVIPLRHIDLVTLHIALPLC